MNENAKVRGAYLLGRGVFYWARFGLWGRAAPSRAPTRTVDLEAQGGEELMWPPTSISPYFPPRISAMDFGIFLHRQSQPCSLWFSGDSRRRKKGMAQCNKLWKLIKSTITVFPPIWMEIRTGNIPHSPLFSISWIVFGIFPHPSFPGFLHFCLWENLWSISVMLLPLRVSMASVDVAFIEHFRRASKKKFFRASRLFLFKMRTIFRWKVRYYSNCRVSWGAQKSPF